MANYAIDPALLQSYLPAGLELDLYQGQCFVSLIGFYFRKVRLKGIPIPFHTQFEEVNLRFYVRRQMTDGESRRGVVFVRELVPITAFAIAQVANAIYGERYAVSRMSHTWASTDLTMATTYRWGGRLQHNMTANSAPYLQPIEPGSVEEFITEHYWGYARKRDGRTVEYAVQHPRWQVYPLQSFVTDADFGALYGERFAFLTGRSPENVLLAEGSAVAILDGTAF